MLHSGSPLVRLPNVPVLVAGLREVAWLSPSGEFTRVSPTEAAAWVVSRPPILWHAPATARRLGVERFPAFDLLELFAFVRPARFCLPTPRGLAQALDLPHPADLDDEAATLHAATRALLSELAAQPQGARLRSVAWAMARGGWPWGPVVLAALGLPAADNQRRHIVASLSVWDDLPEWSE